MRNETSVNDTANGTNGAGCNLQVTVLDLFQVFKGQTIILGVKGNINIISEKWGIYNGKKEECRGTRMWECNCQKRRSKLKKETKI